jgi:hypothetical protein
MTTTTSQPWLSAGDEPASKWRSQIDKIAVLRHQTPQELDARREKLIEELAKYLKIVAALRSPRAQAIGRAGILNRKTAEFRRAWHCDGSWLKAWEKLLEYPFRTAPPTKQQLEAFLNFPSMQSSRPTV